MLENCDKVVVQASNRLRNGFNPYTRRILSRIDAQLNTLIGLFSEEEEAKKDGSAVVSNGTVNLATIYGKSKQLNGLVVKKIYKLTKVAINLDYPELFLNLANRAILEARVISTVSKDIIVEWAEQQWRNLQVDIRRTRGTISFVLRNIKDPDYVRDEIKRLFGEAKEFTIKVYKDCLAINTDKVSLQKNLAILLTFFIEKVNNLKNKPAKLVNQTLNNSKTLYNRVVARYNQTKAILSQPQLGSEPAVTTASTAAH